MVFLAIGKVGLIPGLRYGNRCRSCGIGDRGSRTTYGPMAHVTVPGRLSPPVRRRGAMKVGTVAADVPAL